MEVEGWSGGGGGSGRTSAAGFASGSTTSDLDLGEFSPMANFGVFSGELSLQFTPFIRPNLAKFRAPHTTFNRLFDKYYVFLGIKLYNKETFMVLWE